MSKKLVPFNGYILLEGIIALGILGVIIGSYMSFNLFLMDKNKSLKQQLALQRILYEEVQLFDVNKPVVLKKYKEYDVQIHFQLVEGEISEVKISDGKEQFSIKKE